MAQGSGTARSSGRLSGSAARRAIRDAMAVVPMVVTQIELWKTERLIPLERNPRTHSDEQIGEIAASMREFGFLWPIMVNGKTRRIVAGNGRYLAAVRLGLPVVPVVEERHLTPLQRRAFISEGLATLERVKVRFYRSGTSPGARPKLSEEGTGQ